jgi:GR25 family glycosyltransferase involved in LPS biosynthesis
MRSLIIHMRGDARRAPNVARLMTMLPDPEVIDAVIGRDVLATGAARVHPGDLHRPRYPFAPGPGEVGCFLSHRACWQQIADGGDDYALIVEDDMAADPALWAEALDLIAAHAGPDSFIRLPAKAREKPVRTIATTAHARLFLPRVIGLQTVAQVVGRNAARRLLVASAGIDRPVDTLLQMHWITGQPVHTILPCGVRELTAELGGSTIQKQTPTGGKLAREVKRAAYRCAIALRPQRP